MIVRIMGEGQVKLADSHFAELNALDDELLTEMENGDGPGFRATLTALLDKVRELGTPLPDDSLDHRLQRRLRDAARPPAHRRRRRR
ncbi:PspA-associated protein PspAA, partial [Streptomyces albidoflavus]